MAHSLGGTGSMTGTLRQRNQPPAATTTMVATAGSTVRPWRGLSRWLLEQQPEVVIAKMEETTQGFVEFWKSHKDEGPVSPGYMQPSELIEEIQMYGEMVEAVYDTLLTTNTHSPLFGGCMPGVLEPGHLLSEYAAGEHPKVLVSQPASRYKVVQQLRADSGPFKLVVSKGRNYMGIIAQGPDEATEEEGTKEFDVAIVFRGTVLTSEWKSNAKALQVAWKGGHPVSPPPAASDMLNGPIFQGSLQVFAISFVGSLILLQSPLVEWFSTDSDALAPVVGAAAKLLGGLVTSLLGVPDEGGAVSFSAALGLLVFVVQGFGKAFSASPTDWAGNVWRLARGIVPWAIFWIRNLFSGIFTRGDALFSYGFKEMYCDAKLGLDKDGKLENPPTLRDGCIAIPPELLDKLLPPSPRLMVFRALNQIMAEVQKHNADPRAEYKRRIKSITVTGHSLGGALAGVCGFDLSTTLQEALQATASRSISDADKEACVDLYDLIAQQRAQFMRSIRNLPREDCPAVGVVTFAAPRVGDDEYAAAFKGRSLTNPLHVALPLAGGLGAKLSVFFRDTLDLLLNLPWWAWSAREAASYNKHLKAKPSEVPPAAMLRLVNIHDVVPDVPPALPFRPFRYVHGGYTLALNSLYLPYLKTSQLTGASLNGRHNLEVYLNLFNPSRDRSLVNKGDDLLAQPTDDSGKPIPPVVPPAWWNPIPNKGMQRDKDGKWKYTL